MQPSYSVYTRLIRFFALGELQIVSKKGISIFRVRLFPESYHKTEDGKEDAAVNYLQSHPAGFYTKGLNKVARTFSDLRKKRDAVLDSRDLNPEQKKRAIDALDKIMTEIAKQTVELVGSSNEKFRQ